MIGEETATVLVTVKTYPSPSDKYGETVCVAGVRLDRGHLEWIRLYPMRFRLVDYEQQFTKYEVIEVPVVSPGGRDPRPESMRPDQTRLRSVRRIDTGRNWAERRQLMRPLIGATTTCDLIAANNAVDYSQPAPSLGLVKVHDARISVADGDPWDDRQLAKVSKAAQPDLFNTDGFKELEPAPFRVTVRYRCGSPGCPSHEPSLLDWETGQAGRRWSREAGSARAKEMLLQKYEGLFDASHDAHLYVGNLHQHRASFSGLGVWSPKVEPSDLFDGGVLSYA
jgi:hypothetical protein